MGTVTWKKRGSDLTEGLKVKIQQVDGNEGVGILCQA
jgi:hypothetical protein